MSLRQYCSHLHCIATEFVPKCTFRKAFWLKLFMLLSTALICEQTMIHNCVGVNIAHLMY